MSVWPGWKGHFASLTQFKYFFKLQRDKYRTNGNVGFTGFLGSRKNIVYGVHIAIFAQYCLHIAYILNKISLMGALHLVWFPDWLERVGTRYGGSGNLNQVTWLQPPPSWKNDENSKIEYLSHLIRYDMILYDMMWESIVCGQRCGLGLILYRLSSR